MSLSQLNIFVLILNPLEMGEGHPVLLCCVLLSAYFIELTKSFVTFRGDKLPRTRGPGGTDQLSGVTWLLCIVQ